jgi:hypothetical protein
LCPLYRPEHLDYESLKELFSNDTSIAVSHENATTTNNNDNSVSIGNDKVLNSKKNPVSDASVKSITHSDREDSKPNPNGEGLYKWWRKRQFKLTDPLS